MKSWLRMVIVLMCSLTAGLVGFALPFGLPMYGSTLGPGLGAIVGAFIVIIIAQAVERHLDKVSKVDYVHEAANPITFIVRMATWLFIGLILLSIILMPLMSPPHQNH